MSEERRAELLQLVDSVSKRHGITQRRACQLITKFLAREQKRVCIKGWWVKLLDAQFMTHIGPHKRIRCGRETTMSHVTLEPGGYCHDCGCMRGEYHVFGCDSEECSSCRGQAFCCDCLTE